MIPVKINLNEAIELLKKNDNILILCHRFPDGDTLGSAFGLCGTLQKIGKHARVLSGDGIPPKFKFMQNAVKEENFEPSYVVSIDVADSLLLGSLRDEYADKVDLCIDHHGTNVLYAKKTYVEPSSSATAEIVYLISKQLCANLSPEIADCLYTGIATDTGCFKFSNVTSRTHRIAAELIESGCDSAKICKAMFDTKSKSRIDIEREVLEKLEFHYGGLCAMVILTRDMIARTGAIEDDIDGISSLPRMIEGVSVGVTIREIGDNSYKISLRTENGIDAASIASCFGGGGHKAAAGCNISGTEAEVKDSISKAVGELFTEMELI